MNREEMLRVHDLHNNDALNQGRMEAVDEAFAGDYYGHYAGMPDVPGREGQRQLVSAVRSGFPDINFTVEDRLVEGDKVFVRWSATGTHLGEFSGIPATGKKVTVTGMVIHQMAEGKIQESWECVNTLSLLQQMGVVPEMGG